MAIIAVYCAWVLSAQLAEMASVLPFRVGLRSEKEGGREGGTETDKKYTTVLFSLDMMCLYHPVSHRTYKVVQPDQKLWLSFLDNEEM